MGDVEKLEVWKISHTIAVEVYKLTLKGTLSKDFSLRDQIRRAAISMPSNIAEGEESGFNKLGIRYFYNAKASLAELKAQLLIARDISYISEMEYNEKADSLDLLSRKLRRLIDYRKGLIK